MVAARILAQSYLGEVDTASKRVLAGADDDALHDFRVGVRRLRSCLRVYRPHLEDTVKRRHRRWLRRLTRATNESRDLAVQMWWLRKRRKLDDTIRPAVERLKVRLKERTTDARAKALRVIKREYASGRDELRAVVSRYEGEVDPSRPQPPTCGAVAGTAVLALADQLGAQLGSAGSADDTELLHDARITGKRLRYLIEPLAPDLTAADGVVRKLKSFQDTLGRINDCAALAARIREESADLEFEERERQAAAALQALHKFVEAERESLFDRMRQNWQRDGEALLGQLRAVGRELETHRVDAAIEIERKFLLQRLPRIPAGAEVLRIDQGWLPGERLIERVRRVRGDDRTRWYRTVKTGAGLQRHEIEEETTEDVFRALWRLTRGRRVSKRRFRVTAGPLTWEIDRFTGHQLVLAEVELPTPDTPSEPPDWLRDCIVREVTGEPQYYNINLAG